MESFERYPSAIKDHALLRKAIGMPRGDHELNPERMLKIHQAFCETYPAGSPNAGQIPENYYYDVGHQFVKKHLLQALTKDSELNLQKSEKRILDLALEKVYSPTRDERKIALGALEYLEKNPQRWQKIKNALNTKAQQLKKSIEEFRVQQEILLKQEKIRSDIAFDQFANSNVRMQMIAMGMLDSKILKEIVNKEA